jgi:hypothetical protein
MPRRKPWHDVQGESLKAALRVSQARSKTPACWPVRQHRPLEANLERLSHDHRATHIARQPSRRAMTKPKPKERKVAIRVRVKPSVKAMAECLAQRDARSMADWLERLIAAEAARRTTKRKEVRRAQ